MREHLTRIEPDAIEHLRRLVDVNSFTHNRHGVLAVGAMCEELFAPLGFEARRIRSVTEDCGDHLILERGKGAVALVFVGHLDTVYPPDTPFVWADAGRKIFGPGVCDIKGGIVLLWMILSALYEKRPALWGATRMKILLNATEEGGCADFPGIARDEVRGARACLVYEPGFAMPDRTTTVAVARKGAARFLVESHGVEAHSGHAHARGANAIRELARVIERIEALTDVERELTFNVGLVSGGTTVNSVPAHAACHVDLRAWTVEDYEDGRALLWALAGEGTVASRETGVRCRVVVTELPGYPPWPKNDASTRLGKLAQAIGARQGLPLSMPRRAGGSDGAHVWDHVPTLDGLGPIGKNAHCATRDLRTGREPESVERASFIPRALLSAHLIEELCST